MRSSPAAHGVAGVVNTAATSVSTSTADSSITAFIRALRSTSVADRQINNCHDLMRKRTCWRRLWIGNSQQSRWGLERGIRVGVLLIGYFFMFS